MRQTDDERLEELLGNTKKVHWFDRSKQNRIVFDIASEIVVRGCDDVDHAIDKAQELVDRFYHRVIAKSTKQHRNTK